MLFKTLAKDEFRKLIERILEGTEVVGPKAVTKDKDGNPVHQFLPVKSFGELALDYRTTAQSAKTYFLPYREKLSTYKLEDNDWTQEIKYRIQPRVMVGLHACDIAGLLKLDKVFAKDFFPSPYYKARRGNTAIIGIDHEPLADCFCQSVGADGVSRGFDLFLTDIGDKYFVAIGSDGGFGMLQKANAQAVTDDDRKKYLDVRKRMSGSFKTHLNVKDLPKLLDIEFESNVWKAWGDKCLSCGSCAMVCPTCYCYGVSEDVSMDFSSASKVKQLYSCNLLDFAQVAGGHNFRPTRESRLKYRYYHQHRGFVEAYDEPKCVGCNRCGRTCLAGINPAAVIRDLEAEEKK